MIHAQVHDETDREIFRAWLRQAPDVGQLLWLTGSQRDEVAARYGTSSFKVVEVANWINADWAPSTHVDEPAHILCIHVEPVTRQ